MAPPSPKQTRDVPARSGTDDRLSSTGRLGIAAPTRTETEKGELTVLYRRYGRRVYGRALGMLRDAEEARDVMQDTFLAFLHSERTLRGKAAPFTVLYQIATHKAVDRLRHRARWADMSGSPGGVNETGAECRLEGATADEGDMARVDALNHLTVLTLNASSQSLTAGGGRAPLLCGDPPPSAGARGTPAQ
ncbi:MAG: RNA polymerase sigma factor [Archangium sp.]